jgi:hypothetical protein
MIRGRRSPEMLRLRKDQMSLWESVLPPELFRLNEELTKVDQLLDDERFFAPFEERFSTRIILFKLGVRGHRRIFCKPQRPAATDRGFYSGLNIAWLKTSNVKQVAMPVRGKAAKERLLKQMQVWFKRLKRFRAGSEAKISLLKRKFGLRRSLMHGDLEDGIWVGQGIFPIISGRQPE